MEKTLNYNLNKPAQTDFYDIDDFNENSDIIDAALKELDERGAPTVDLSGCVPTSRKVNNKALSADISLAASDVGLGNVTNESKATMFTNPALTGTPTAPTAAAGTNTTQIATTEFVMANAGGGFAPLNTITNAVTLSPAMVGNLNKVVPAISVPAGQYGEVVSSGTTAQTRTTNSAIYMGTTYTFNSANGNFTVPATTSIARSATGANNAVGKYFITQTTSSGNQTGSTMFKVNTATYSGSTLTLNCYTYSNVQGPLFAQVTITIPLDNSNTIEIGAELEIVNMLGSDTTISAAAGVTVIPGENWIISGLGQGISLKKTATNEWLVKGDLS